MQPLGLIIYKYFQLFFSVPLAYWSPVLHTFPYIWIGLFPLSLFSLVWNLNFAKSRLVCPQHPFGYPYHYRALCKIPKRSGNQHRSKRDFVTFWFNTLRPRPNGSHFPGDIFKYIFLNEIVWIAIKISLMFVLTGSVGRRQAIIRTNAS